MVSAFAQVTTVVVMALLCAVAQLQTFETQSKPLHVLVPIFEGPFQVLGAVAEGVVVLFAQKAGFVGACPGPFPTGFPCGFLPMAAERRVNFLFGRGWSV